MPTTFVRDLSVHYEEAGPAGGVPVLLVHGLGSSSALWAGVLPRLAALGYRVVAADCRGHGATSKPPGPYSIDQMADDWAALQAALRLPPAHWVGVSMGGAIALAAALRHPALVRSLALVDTWARTDADFAALLHARLAALDAGGPDAYAEYAFPQVYSDGYRRAHPEALDLYRDRVRQLVPPALRAAVGALLGHDVEARLGEIRVPTTVLVGEADALLPPRHSQAVASGIPGARLVRFPDVGHLPMVEAPDAFLDALAAHLRGA